jgi:outer membrane protein TolC
MYILKIILTLLIVCSNVFAEVVSLDEILNYADKNYPDLLIQYQKIQAQMGKEMKASGAFDTQLEGSTKNYLEGYYDASLSSFSVDKPLQFANSSVSLGHKRGIGRIAVYDRFYDTNSSGEYFLKLKASLWRYRDIDPRRFDLWINENKTKIEKKLLDLKKVELKNKINSLYWKWFFYHESSQVYKKLVELSEQRIDNIKKRVASNDLARIYLTESIQYLLNFQRDLNKNEIEKKIVIAKLKVFYPMIIDSSIPNQVDELIYQSEIIDKVKTQLIISSWPEFKLLNFLDMNQDFDIKLAQQKLAPKIDVEATRYQSQGQIEPYLNENIVALKFEVPIERNLGRGDIQRAKAEKRIIEARKELLERNIEAEIESLLARIKGDQDILKLLRDEVDATLKLQAAEWSRFKAGASDFFLINTRDVNYAKARIRQLKTFVDLRQADFELNQWTSFDN